MRKFVTSVLAAATIAAPLHAASWQDQGSEMRRGAFAGAQFKISFGGQVRPEAHANLAIAPTRSRISNGGMVRTQIGEGVTLRLSAATKPTLMLAGLRADRSLGINRSGQADPKNRIGLSTGAWIGIGVVAAIGVGALLFADYCHDKISSLCGDDE